MGFSARPVGDLHSNLNFLDIEKELEIQKGSFFYPEEPRSPTKGQLWYNGDTETLHVYSDDPNNPAADFIPIQTGVDFSGNLVLTDGANDYQFVGATFFGPGGSTGVTIEFTTLDGDTPQLSKAYKVMINDDGGPYDGTVVYKALPIDDRGPDGTDDFELLVFLTSFLGGTILAANFAVRRTGGSNDISLIFRVRTRSWSHSWTDLSDPSFSGTDSTVATVLNQYLLHEPDSEGTDGQVLATDGAGGRLWTDAASGTGDVSGPSSSVDNEIALFSGTGGKTIKRATTTGILKGTSGVISAATAGTDYFAPGSTDLTDLDDTPSSYSGEYEAGTPTLLQVKSSEDGMEFITLLEALDGHQLPWPIIMGDWDGWSYLEDTPTRTGAQTFTVPGDYTTTFTKGIKLQWLDSGGTKFGHVLSSSYSAPDTTVTIVTNTDYVVATGMTFVATSRAESPQGFPDWFNYTPTLSASGSMTYTSTSVGMAYYTIKGQTVFIRVQASGTTGGTASNTLQFTLPVVPHASEVSNVTGLGGRVQDGGASLAAFGFITTIGSMRKTDSSNFGLGGTRVLAANGFYRMA